MKKSYGVNFSLLFLLNVPLVLIGLTSWRHLVFGIFFNII